MPYRSIQQERWAHTSAGTKALGGASAVAEWDRATKGKNLPRRAKKKKVKISVNNHIKAFGEQEGKHITINVKKHKGDKKELADTVFHEEYHVRHPKATEKKTYAVTRKAMKEMTYQEKEALANKVKRKTMHYKEGALKRKFKMGRGKVEPGSYFNKMKESKTQKSRHKNGLSVKKVGIMGLV